MKIFIVNGAPGSGKTTFEQLCQKINTPHKTWIISTIDPIKQAAERMGWDGQKDPKSRRFLSDLKDLATEYNDCSLNYCLKEIELLKSYIESVDMTDKSDDFIMFIDCREPAEIDKLKKATGAQTLCIRRSSAAGQKFSNHADAEVYNYAYDYVIENDGTLDDFAVVALEFLEKHFECQFYYWGKKVTKENLKEILEEQEEQEKERKEKLNKLWEEL